MSTMDNETKKHHILKVKMVYDKLCKDTHLNTLTQVEKDYMGSVKIKSLIKNGIVIDDIVEGTDEEIGKIYNKIFEVNGIGAKINEALFKYDKSICTDESKCMQTANTNLIKKIDDKCPVAPAPVTDTVVSIPSVASDATPAPAPTGGKKRRNSRKTSRKNGKKRTHKKGRRSIRRK